MLGFGDKHGHTVDESTLPIFVHTLQSGEAFIAAQKVWQANGRYVMLDPGNHKELLRFAFPDPKCVVWLERDQGRTEIFELILQWDAEGRKEDVTEVYVILDTNEATIGDDTRVKSLLNAILASPAIVPVNQQSGPAPAQPQGK